MNVKTMTTSGESVIIDGTEENTAKVVIGGDICPVFRSEKLFIEGNPDRLFGKLLSSLQTADLAIANLECPLTDSSSPILKIGPGLRASEECITGIKASGFHALGLANNHILDYGTKGIADTLAVCAQAGITTFGAGMDLAEASKPMIRDSNGIRIGFYGLTHKEFSCATLTSAGANPLETEALWRVIPRIKAQCDVLTVLLHAGVENYPYPSPRLLQLCHDLVDLGAGIIVCQHSHCAGCYEWYNGGVIVYGQGNLIFDYLPVRGGIWNEGFLVNVEVSRGGPRSCNLIPYIQCREEMGARPMDAGDSQKFLQEIEARSREMSDPARLQRRWFDHCLAETEQYYGYIRGYRLSDRIKIKLCALLGIKWRPFNDREKAMIANVVRCTSLREVLETVFFEQMSEPIGDAASTAASQ
jgi:poly-gamma-glutamate synthesis protein (capsule biosynthesis protein)